MPTLPPQIHQGTLLYGSAIGGIRGTGPGIHFPSTEGFLNQTGGEWGGEGGNGIKLK